MHAVLLTDLLLKNLDKQSSIPMQKQMYDTIRFAVLDHTLIAGQKLPSSRALAADLEISRITISLTYDRLIAENYLVTRAGNGTYVAPTLTQPLGAAPESVHTQHSMQLSRRGSQLDYLPGGMGNTTGAFVPGIADSQAFPFHIWKRLVARHLSKGNLALSGYADHGGRQSVGADAILTQGCRNSLPRPNTQQMMVVRVVSEAAYGSVKISLPGRKRISANSKPNETSNWAALRNVLRATSYSSAILRSLRNSPGSKSPFRILALSLAASTSTADRLAERASMGPVMWTAPPTAFQALVK